MNLKQYVESILQGISEAYYSGEKLDTCTIYTWNGVVECAKIAEMISKEEYDIFIFELAKIKER